MWNKKVNYVIAYFLLNISQFLCHSSRSSTTVQSEPLYLNMEGDIRLGAIFPIHKQGQQGGKYLWGNSTGGWNSAPGSLAIHLGRDQRQVRLVAWHQAGREGHGLLR